MADEDAESADRRARTRRRRRLSALGGSVGAVGAGVAGYAVPSLLYEESGRAVLLLAGAAVMILVWFVLWRYLVATNRESPSEADLLARQGLAKIRHGLLVMVFTGLFALLYFKPDRFPPEVKAWLIGLMVLSFTLSHLDLRRAKRDYRTASSGQGPGGP